MKKLLLIFVLTLIYSSIIAQNKVSRVVLDEKGDPLSGVVVKENNLIASNINGTLSWTDGKFKLRTIQNQGALKDLLKSGIG
ncbi:MAG: hypothetical protein PHT07_08260 [Paludibacter sp.]|nr:hypothetical protein [Paludibacter sp.]